LDVRTVVDLIAALATAGTALWAFQARRVRSEDRATIAGLQRVLADPVPELPGISIGSVVLSASTAGVGGDVVDVFALDARFALLLVADVRGKGVEAAAHTAFIRYAIRTLALEGDGDPAVVVAKFNAMYHRTIRDTEAFVVLILGIIDSQTGEVRYASAGHEPAFVRRRTGSIVQLAPTGPIVGPSAYSAYATDSVVLGAGDTMVWTTDGLTESRDRKRRLLGADGLAAWIAGAPPGAVALADWLVASLRRRSIGVDDDDVAVLTVAYDPIPTTAPLHVLRPASHLAD
jgi:sigma-B regulation protein RsbU (phosphoserine phosphatase)